MNARNGNSAATRWSFSGIEADFEEHIGRSVPYYREGHDLVSRLGDFFLRDESLVYEIGVSTGALARRFLARNHNRPGLRYVGIDPVRSMIDHARRAGAADPRASFVCDDVVNVDLDGCTLVLSYYAIQFIRPAVRQQVIDKIYRALEWGGALIMFEKVRGPDARFQDYMSQVYTDMKLENGFTEQEVIQKARSLKGVLEPFSSAGNCDLLRRAGFQDITTVFKWVCFEGWLAIK